MGKNYKGKIFPVLIIHTSCAYKVTISDEVADITEPLLRGGLLGVSDTVLRS